MKDRLIEHRATPLLDSTTVRPLALTSWDRLDRFCESLRSRYLFLVGLFLFVTFINGCLLFGYRSPRQPYAEDIYLLLDSLKGAPTVLQPIVGIPFILLRGVSDFAVLVWAANAPVIFAIFACAATSFPAVLIQSKRFDWLLPTGVLRLALGFAISMGLGVPDVRVAMINSSYALNFILLLLCLAESWFKNAKQMLAWTVLCFSSNVPILALPILFGRSIAERSARYAIPMGASFVATVLALSNSNAIPEQYETLRVPGVLEWATTSFNSFVSLILLAPFTGLNNFAFLTPGENDFLLVVLASIIGIIFLQYFRSLNLKLALVVMAMAFSAVFYPLLRYIARDYYTSPYLHYNADACDRGVYMSCGLALLIWAAMLFSERNNRSLSGASVVLLLFVCFQSVRSSVFGALEVKPQWSVSNNPQAYYDMIKGFESYELGMGAMNYVVNVLPRRPNGEYYRTVRCSKEASREGVSCDYI